MIGGGLAGLMAAEALAAQGVQVDVYDAMPSVGRKFLMRAKGGMNITHSEPLEPFLDRYGRRRNQIVVLLDAFSPDALRTWLKTLDVETFVGSSGRVFPTDMKAAPMLRAWLHRCAKRAWGSTCATNGSAGTLATSARHRRCASPRPTASKK